MGGWGGGGGGGEVVFLKVVALGRFTMLQWMVPKLWLYGQQKLD